MKLFGRPGDALRNGRNEFAVIAQQDDFRQGQMPNLGFPALAFMDERQCHAHTAVTLLPLSSS